MKNANLSFKIAAVFIGTIVGAGLASGQEVLQFFTLYGFKGLPGIVICGILYIITGYVTVAMSYKFHASSYNDLVYISCGKYLGLVVDFLTTLFLFGGTCIILAGSGAIFRESFKLPWFLGVALMAVVTIIVVFNSTGGLIFINSIIVPCMILVLLSICSAVFLSRSSIPNGMAHDIIQAPVFKNNWFFSTLLYMSFNMLSTTGVLAPMTIDIKDSKAMSNGVILGSIGLFLLTALMDIVLLLNEPNIFHYSIPMLYIAGTVGDIARLALSVVIWLEMFSTAVSDVYSLAKKMTHSFNLDYKLSVIIIIICAFPFTYIGFKNLINFLYPSYGFISLIYIICLLTLYFKTIKNPGLTK